MDQLRALLASFSRRQKITIAVVAALVIAGLVSLSHWNHERDFKPLYTGLAQEDAAAVLTKVRESGTEYRISESGSSILVPAAKVAELRLQLASAGVPRSGRLGFELFDKTNFGTSDFAEQINYHRALEGELERSVMALSEVEQARIHITFAKDSIYSESRQPAKASVLVKLHPGTRLSPQNVTAISQLMASAVEGLQPEAVSVVDMRGNLLSKVRKTPSPDDPEPPASVTEYRQQVERDLVAKINATLEPLLGADKFRAAASVECDFTTGEQSEETFDPAKSVMVSSQRTEDVAGAGATSGVPGTASNLPRPTSRPGSGTSGVTRRTENIAYQTSRVVRHLRLPQGTVKHLSVSVLVDHAVRWEGSGAKAKRIVEAPSAEKIKAIRDLVAGVIGLSTDRNDQLVVEALPFEATLSPEQLPQASPADGGAGSDKLPPWLRNLSPRSLAIGGGAAIGLLTLLFILKKMSSKKKHKQAEIQAQLVAAKPAEDAINNDERATQQLEAQIAEQAAVKKQQELEAMTALKLPQVKTKKSEVLTKHIAEEAKKDATSMVHVLRNWINEAEEK